MRTSRTLDVPASRTEACASVAPGPTAAVPSALKNLCTTVRQSLYYLGKLATDCPFAPERDFL